MQDQWALAYSPTPAGLPPAQLEPTWLEPPRGRFYADPFLCDWRGEAWVFFEDYDGQSGRGQISASPLLNFQPQPVLQLPWHLSYPQILRIEDQVFLIPEQHQTGQVVLYRCLDFPHRWSKEAVLLDGFAGVDPTVILLDGTWWMWIGDQHRRARDRTFLFHAPNLTGPWRPHRSNPVIERTDLARPGGQPWLHPTLRKWLRPAQNRSQTYGGSLVIYCVERLDCQDYQETEWARWEAHPDWTYSQGLHHVCSLGDWTVWDAKRYVKEL